MHLRTLSSFIAILILTVLLSIRISYGASPQTSAVQTESSGTRFSINNLPPRIDTLQHAHTYYIRPNFEHQSGVLNHSQSQIPQLVKIAGVPFNSTNHRVTMSGSKWLPIDSNLKLISPDVINPEIKGQEEDSFIESRTWPAAVSILDVSIFRNLRIARIQIIPVRYNDGRLEYLASADIRLTWQDEDTTTPGSNNFAAIKELSDNKDYNLYQDILLNKEQALAFVQQPAKRTKIMKTAFKAGGDFLVFYTSESGIYKIGRQDFESAGISAAGINPQHIRFYNNGGQVLPENLSVQRADSLTEIPVLFEGNSDQTFGEQEFFYFYAHPVNDWTFKESAQQWQHYSNPYATENAFWVSWDSGPVAPKRLTAETPQGATEVTTDQGLRLQKIENEIHNPIRSGRDWFGSELNSKSPDISFDFKLVQPASANEGSVRLKVVSLLTGRNTISASWNEANLGTIIFNGSSAGGGYRNLRTGLQSFSLKANQTNSQNTLKLEYASSNVAGTLYVDWIEVVAEDALQAVDGTLSFATRPTDNIISYSLSGLGPDTKIFEISNNLEPRLLQFSTSSGNITFKDQNSRQSPHRFWASENTMAPVRAERYTSTDLRSTQNKADMLIIAGDDFLEISEQLAEHKRAFRSFDVEVVPMKAITMEFGWGLTDPVALRDFIAYAFHNWQKQPAYVLLVGDATYDYRGVSNPALSNHVPSYQTDELNELFNRNIEAFFTYVNGNDRTMDLAIGRIPAQTVTDAENLIEKIISYEKAPERGFWRTMLTMVADDELLTGGRASGETIHTRDAELIAEQDVPDMINLRKIYLMEYEAVLTASVAGVRKPKAQNDIIDQLNLGTLIINYVGHGNSKQWAHEQVFDQGSDISRIQNGMRLPFFVAATCDFGRYDLLNGQSFPEELLNAKDRGAVGFLTSSRVVYASDNKAFNSQYYRRLFSRGLETMAIGDAMVLARLTTTSTTNDEKYSILGDPSMHLALPTKSADIFGITPDTLTSLSRTEINGGINFSGNGQIMQNGDVEIRVFDNANTKQYVTQLGGKVSYILPGNLLYKGKNRLNNGAFKAMFIVPKDITYGGTSARISIYGAGDSGEAIGFKNDIPISLRSALLRDPHGPEIKIGFEDRDYFMDGDMVPIGKKLQVTLADTLSGINITGEVGHKITLTFDENVEEQLDVTSRFLYFENSYHSGQLSVALPELSPGLHRARLKAWDNSNNSSFAEFTFILTSRGELSLENVLNFPNPFQNSTTFTFKLNAAASINIGVYTSSGRLIKKIEDISGEPGFNAIPWDGRDADGDMLANGIYLYKISAKPAPEAVQKTIEKIGKMAIYR